MCGVWSITVSKDGAYLATGAYDKIARLWDLNSLACIRSFIGHSSAVYSVAFSPDSTYLATGSDDKTARLWDVQSGNCIRSFLSHENSVSSVTFSPDGSYLATGSMDNTAKLWELPPSEVKTTVQQGEPAKKRKRTAAIADLDADAVAARIEALGPAYVDIAAKFKECGCDGDFLAEMSESQLEETLTDLGVTNRVHQRRLKYALLGAFS